MVRLQLPGLILAGVLAVGRVVAPAADNVSHITILVQDALGAEVKSADIEFRELGTGEDYSAAFYGHQAEVPYGYYSLRVFEGGFRVAARVVRLLQPRFYVRVGLSLGESKRLRLSGTVRPGSFEEKKLWLKVVPLLTNDSTTDTLVQPDGSFEVTGLCVGKYLLILYGGEISRYSSNQ